MDLTGFLRCEHLWFRQQSAVPELDGGQQWRWQSPFQPSSTRKNRSGRRWRTRYGVAGSGGVPADQDRRRRGDVVLQARRCVRIYRAVEDKRPHPGWEELRVPRVPRYILV